MSEKIKYCVNCNSPVPAHAKFCFECGGHDFQDTPKAKDRYCKYCFIKLDSDEDVCPICEGEEFVNSIDDLLIIKNKDELAKQQEVNKTNDSKINRLKANLKDIEVKISEQKKIMMQHPSMEDMRTHLAQEQNKSNQEIEKAKSKYNKFLDDRKKAKTLEQKSKEHESEFNKVQSEIDDITQEISIMTQDIYALEQNVKHSQEFIDEYEKRINKLAGKKPEFYNTYLARLYADVGSHLYEWERYYEAQYFLLKAHKLGNHIASSFLLFMYLDPDNILYSEKEADKIADDSIEFFKNNKQNMFYESVYRLCCSIKDSKHYSAWAVNEVVNNFVFTFESWTYVNANYILLKRQKCYIEMYLILLTAFNKTISYVSKHETKFKDRISKKINKLKSLMSAEEEKVGMSLYTLRDLLIPDYFTLSEARIGYSKSLNAYKELINEKYYKVLSKYAYLSRITYTVSRLDDRNKDLLLKVDFHQSPTAIAELGWYYLEHFTVRSQNPKMAVEYFTKAYNKECLDGAVGLGICYLKGHGVEKDEAKGLEYLKLAAEHTCHRAYTELGKYYFSLNKYDEALPYLELAYYYKEPVHYEIAYAKYKKGALAHKVIPYITKYGTFSYTDMVDYNLELVHLLGLMAGAKYDHPTAVKLMNKAAENKHVESIKWMIKESEKQKDLVKLEHFKKLLKEVGA